MLHGNVQQDSREGRNGVTTGAKALTDVIHATLHLFHDFLMGFLWR